MISLPVVHHVYPTACTTLTKPPGLGDYLRGSIALAHHARERHFNLRLDFSRHPIGKFLRAPGDGPPTPEAFAEFFDGRATLLYDWLDELNSRGGGSVATNLLPHASRINADVCGLVLNQLNFVPSVRDAALEIHQKISTDAFAAVHLRVPDEDFKTDKIRTSRLFKYIERRLIPVWGRRLAIISNNAHVKQAICEQYQLLPIDTGTVHLGEGGSDADVRDTLIDFAILSRAARIYSHSAYAWKSGFSHWCATLHGIPFEQMEVEPPSAARRIVSLASHMWRR